MDHSGTTIAIVVVCETSCHDEKGHLLVGPILCKFIEHSSKIINGMIEAKNL
jgi:hypothetical protein